MVKRVQHCVAETNDRIYLCFCERRGIFFITEYFNCIWVSLFKMEKWTFFFCPWQFIIMVLLLWLYGRPYSVDVNESETKQSVATDSTIHTVCDVNVYRFIYYWTIKRTVNSMMLMTKWHITSDVHEYLQRWNHLCVDCRKTSLRYHLLIRVCTVHSVTSCDMKVLNWWVTWIWICISIFHALILSQLLIWMR